MARQDCPRLGRSVRVATGPRPERKLRAAQRLLGAARTRARLEGKAEILESLPKGLRSATDTFVWPHVIRLVQYVRATRDPAQDLAARALRPRRLALCLRHLGWTTHARPRRAAVEGGESIWENVVTACAPCNLRKGDRCSRTRAPPGASRARRPGAVHPPRHADDPAGLAAVPRLGVRQRELHLHGVWPRPMRAMRATSASACRSRSSVSTTRSGGGAPGSRTTSPCCTAPTAIVTSCAGCSSCRSRRGRPFRLRHLIEVSPRTSPRSASSGTTRKGGGANRSAARSRTS